MGREGKKEIKLRLGEQADILLRQNLQRKGDLTERFIQALSGTNWDKVEIPRRRKTYQHFFHTSIYVRPELHLKLKEYAESRGVEMSALIDAIIVVYYSQELNEKA